jgi:hypothetical protein
MATNIKTWEIIEGNLSPINSTLADNNDGLVKSVTHLTY